MWFVYILKCRDKTLYTGSTTDLARRLDEHNSGKGAKYTSSRIPTKLIWACKAKDRSAALKKEIRIKTYTRTKKLRMIAESDKITLENFVESDFFEAAISR